MKKRTVLSLVLVLISSNTFAEDGFSGLSDAAEGIGTYLPYIQGLCYAIASVIAVIGALSIYMGMHTAPQQITKRIMMTVGSCLCFISLATALPLFFGLDGSGSTSGDSSSTSSSEGSSDSFLSSDNGGISQSGILTQIPAIQDNAGNWISFPSGTNMEAANLLMDIYDHMGSGVEGTFRRTMEYIYQQYDYGQIDQELYSQLISLSDYLPHH